MSSTIYLPIMHILHKIYKQYDYVNIIQRRSYHHIWEVPKHRHIQYKIEHPDNTGFLSLLDFKMPISPTGKIYTSFYRKPTTKNFFVHFKSALPLSAKTNYIKNEIKRNHNRCSEEKDKITLTTHFINTLRNHDYPTSITRHLNYKKSQKLHRPSNTCFLKLSHFSEIITKEISRAIYKEGKEILYDRICNIKEKFERDKIWIEG